MADVVGLAYYPNEEGQGLNRGQLHTVTNAMGHVTTFADYNAFGQAETLTDPNGIVTTRVFNGSGRMTAVTTAGLTTGYAYNPVGLPLNITRPGGRTITYSYNPAGQLAGITDNQGNAITYSYDSEGRRIGEEVRDPQNVLARYVGYGYDDMAMMAMTMSRRSPMLGARQPALSMTIWVEGCKPRPRTPGRPLPATRRRAISPASSMPPAKSPPVHKNRS